LRSWELDLRVYKRILELLPPELKTERIPLPEPVPDLSILEKFASAAPQIAPQPGRTRPIGPIGNLPRVVPSFDAAVTVQPNVGLLLPKPDAGAMQPVTIGSRQIDFGRVESLREPLTRLLPKVTELEALRIWPCFPRPGAEVAVDLRDREAMRDVPNVRETRLA
jgi:hypothetical protein